MTIIVVTVKSGRPGKVVGSIDVDAERERVYGINWFVQPLPLPAISN